MSELLAFMFERQDSLAEMFVEHMQMVALAMVISIVLGTIIGIAIVDRERIASVVLYVASVFMTVPCFALFAILLPILGLNRAPVIIGLVVYTLLPIIRNTYVGFNEVSDALLENARAMGLGPWKIFVHVRLPMALPLMLAGMRTAVMLGISVGAIAAYIGAGGLGEYIFQGISRGNINMVLSSAIILAVTSILIDIVLQSIQRLSERRIT